jgi:hypothetical protein
MSRHGSTANYNRGCRCADCSGANTRAMQRYRDSDRGRAKQRERSRRDSRLRQLCMGYVRDLHPEVWEKFVEMVTEMEKDNA